RSRCDTGQLEGTQSLVVTGELALALEDLDGNRRLVVFSGGEGFRTLGRDRGVALDQLGHHAALGFNTQGQWGDVDEQNVLALALQYTCLQCCANSYNLIRVHALVSFLAGQVLDQFSNGWHTGRTANQDHVSDVGNLDACFSDNVVEWLAGALQQVLG